MARLRKYLLLIFVATYAVTAPLTILYALGYIFNPEQQVLLQTGLVSLNSEPSGATVWVNGLNTKDKTPIVLRNLKPDTYDVQVRLPGRHPWARRITVERERALRLENVLLFPLSYQPEALRDSPLFKMWHVPGGKYLLVLEGTPASHLYLYELEKEKFRPVFLRARDRESTINEVHLHPRLDRALILLKEEGVTRPVLVKFTEEIQVKDLSGLLPDPLTEFRWSLHDADSFFYLKGETLRRFDIERDLLHPKLITRLRGYAPDERGLFALDGRRRFLKITEKGKIQDVLLADPSKANLIFGEDTGERYSIFFLPNPSVFSTLDDAVVLFLSERGRLLGNKLPYFLDQGVGELAPAISHPRMAYRKGKGLWAVDFEREREKVFFESGPAPRKIYEGKEAPTNLLWFYHDQYLLFLEGDRLMVQDFEGEGNAVELMRISGQIPQVVLDAGQGFLYFAHPKGNRLSRIKLFEEPGILPRFGDAQ
jgi:hypothetical protein